jgi:tetratricopeptide (TPR) repeat protein
MRARQGLATTLWDLGRGEEAVGHYREMLRLNPGDNQGNRYSLLNLLVSLKRDDEARALLNQYDDGMAEWLYTGALLAFRKGGATKETDRALQAALKMNPHVPAYLTGQKRIPVRLPDYIGFGDENEAVSYAAGYLSHWRRTPGAVAWLESHLKPARSTRPKPKGTKRNRRKPRK